ncbi:TPA: ImmA/IrrE family metallo-endopeptidase [Klebsiella aerogenes]|nr:ImmA/IrrE family metallo-endopeptidase [Klebsiella aerogenes]
MIVTQDFNPDWVSPPGDTIIDLMDEHGLSDEQLSRKMGLPLPKGQKLLKGEICLDEVIATKLQDIFNVSISFWLKREMAYRSQVAYINNVNDEWLASLPVKDMIKLGWIAKCSSKELKLKKCLEFFDINSVRDFYDKINTEAPLVAFRKSLSFKTEPMADLAWLTRAAQISKQRDHVAWSKEKLKSLIPEIRKLTIEPKLSTFIPALEQKLASAGVSFVVLPTPAGCRASGATCFFEYNKPTVIVSFRYLTDDHFWFTLFHELGHLILHDELSVRLEGDIDVSNKDEQEANRFAADTLIPCEFRTQLEDCSVKNWKPILRIARKIGVSKGICLGYLQHREIIPYTHLNKFKVRYKKEDII